MSFYENRILPYLLNVFMNTKGTREERKRSDRRGSKSNAWTTLT
jgi:hypothetical protein